MGHETNSEEGKVSQGDKQTRVTHNMRGRARVYRHQIFERQLLEQQLEGQVVEND